MIFRMTALAGPLVLGFVLPFVLALGRDRGWNARKSACAAATAAAGWIVLLGILWTFSGHPVSRLLESACFLLAFGAFLYGLFRLTGQIVCGLVVVLLLGTVFYFDPILESAKGAEVHTRVAIAMEWNPYVVMAYSIFDVDLLTRVLYTRSQLAELQHPWPEWPRVALWYVLLGFFCTVGSMGVQAAKLRFHAR